MSTRQPLTFKTANEDWEFEQIHRLNYKTFVEEIPQPVEPGEVILRRHHDLAVPAAQPRRHQARPAEFLAVRFDAAGLARHRREADGIGREVEAPGRAQRGDGRGIEPAAEEMAIGHRDIGDVAAGRLDRLGDSGFGRGRVGAGGIERRMPMAASRSPSR